MLSFGEKMRVMRAVRHVNQVWLSGRAQVALSFIVSCEQGKRELAEDEQQRVRNELDWKQEMDVLIEQLIGWHRQ